MNCAICDKPITPRHKTYYSVIYDVTVHAGCARKYRPNEAWDALIAKFIRMWKAKQQVDS